MKKQFVVSKKSIEDWIDKFHPSAFQKKVKDDQYIKCMANRVGGTSLILHGNPLREALDYVERKGLGASYDGNLTKEEAEEVIKYLNKLYGLKKHRISLSPEAVIRNVGYVRGTLAAGTAAYMNSKAKRVKSSSKGAVAFRKRSSGSRPKLPLPKDTTTTTKETKETKIIKKKVMVAGADKFAVFYTANGDQEFIGFEDSKEEMLSLVECTLAEKECQIKDITVLPVGKPLHFKLKFDIASLMQV